MAGLVPAIHALAAKQDVDARLKAGHDKGENGARAMKFFQFWRSLAAFRVRCALNLKGVDGSGRLVAMPPGGMCTHVVRLTSLADADAELIGWIRTAYDAAG